MFERPPPTCPMCDAPPVPDGWTLHAEPPEDTTSAPWLSEWDTNELLQMGVSVDGSVELAREVVYGASLRALVAEHPYLGDFLEAAALAGRVNPSVMDGVAAVVRAHALWLFGEIGEYEPMRVLGDAIGWCDASPYRELVVLLEGIIADLETRAAMLHRAPDHGTDADGISASAEMRAAWEQSARSAERRARRAGRRAQVVQAELAEQP